MALKDDLLVEMDVRSAWATVASEQRRREQQKTDEARKTRLELLLSRLAQSTDIEVETLEGELRTLRDDIERASIRTL